MIRVQKLYRLGNGPMWSSERNKRLLGQIMFQSSDGQKMVHQHDFVKYYDAKMASVFPEKHDFDRALQSFLSIVLASPVSSPLHSSDDEQASTPSPETARLSPSWPAGSANSTPRALSSQQEKSPHLRHPQHVQHSQHTAVHLKTEIVHTKSHVAKLTTDKESAERQVRALAKQIKSERQALAEVLQGASDRLEETSRKANHYTELFHLSESQKSELLSELEASRETTEELRGIQMKAITDMAEMQKSAQLAQKRHDSQLEGAVEAASREIAVLTRAHQDQMRSASVVFEELASADSTTQITRQENEWSRLTTDDPFVAQLTSAFEMMKSFRTQYLAVQAENQTLVLEMHQQSLDIEAARHTIKSLQGQHSESSSHHTEIKSLMDRFSSHCTSMLASVSSSQAESQILQDKYNQLLSEKNRVSHRLEELCQQCQLISDASEVHRKCVAELTEQLQQLTEERLLRRAQMLRHVCSSVNIILRERRMVAFVQTFFSWKAWAKEGALIAGANELAEIVSASHTPASSPMSHNSVPLGGSPHGLSEQWDLADSFTSPFDVKAYASSLGF